GSVWHICAVPTQCGSWCSGPTSSHANSTCCMPAPRNHDVTPPMNQAYRPMGRQNERFVGARRGACEPADRRVGIHTTPSGAVRVSTLLRSDRGPRHCMGAAMAGLVEAFSYGVVASVLIMLLASWTSATDPGPPSGELRVSVSETSDAVVLHIHASGAV